MDFIRSYFFTNGPLSIQFWWKKCSTSQRFIRKEVTSYKIHILVLLQKLYKNCPQSRNFCLKVRWKSSNAILELYLVKIEFSNLYEVSTRIESNVKTLMGVTWIPPYIYLYSIMKIEFLIHTECFISIYDVSLNTVQSRFSDTFGLCKNCH